MRAGGLPESFIPYIAGGCSTPRTTIGSGVAENRANPIAAHIFRANLTSDTAAVGVGLTFIAEFPLQTGALRDATIGAVEQLALADVLRWNAVRYVVAVDPTG